MTRINVGILPQELTDSHLNAELRELPRIFTAVNKRILANKDFKDIPKSFSLGTGHVLFFYNKCKYLYNRHSQLRNEYKRRFRKEYQFDGERTIVPNHLYNDYIPSKTDRDILIERISTRILESNQKPRYYQNEISKKEAVNLLK